MAKIKFILTAIAAALAAAASPSFADEYGMAGCGLGAMIINGSNSFEQIFVATTNDWTSTKTFGISSGTSHCRDGAKSTANLYFEINKEAIKRDVARGSGETIVSLAQILGCEQSDRLGVSLQRNYKEVFSSSEVTRFMDTVEPLILADSSLKCRAI